MDVKEQIKRSISITDVVSMYVDLKPAGKYLKALCPFHTEKTPSFFVMPDKDSFACYGCNKFGDIFTFTQEIENLSFPDAMNFLIDKFNIPIERKTSHVFFKKDLYVKINEMALKYFRDCLMSRSGTESKRARDYLEQRGIHANTAELFSLGYAENRWDGLYNHLRKESCDIEKAIQLGLLIKSNTNRIYDRFRGRIIFPILSESGTPIAFGGRTLFDEPNKYLNSPDTPLYKKSKHLYGFYLTKKAIREKKYSILVEGYFDVISLYQNGVENVVASLGTALTESQIYLLKRFSDSIYIFYDSDKAGIDAAIRGIEKMFEQNINPQIIMLREDKDPDDFIQEQGLKAFQQLLDQSTDGFKFLIRHISRQYDLTIPERKNHAIRTIMNFVDKISEPIIRNEYVRMVADFFKVDESLLKLKRWSNDSKFSIDPGIGKRLDITPAERIFLESILAMPELIGKVKELFDRELVSVLKSGNIIRLLLRHYNEETKTIDDFRKISEQLSDAERGEFRDIFERAKSIPRDRDHLKKQVESSYFKFRDMSVKRVSHRIDQEIKMAEQANDIERVQQLIKEKTKFIKSKYEYKYNQAIGGAVEQP
ncbi:MAG: DNA primase [Candidatus Aminicenantes bacterium]|nr:DNA primase [Candidatus Aminicenantes bacterium]NIM84618.1 DNA primase [Candidatus Aminicenantes bacterium]NIN21431.1 DNA primase [Candidatus Aminicenantes bacterium]NIN47846.1 DNA primase [Candidatus Aminicenantes bacterium]NIN90784.1 DNA primase [Candidatus Aminicenantes bacterium]